MDSISLSGSNAQSRSGVQGDCCRSVLGLAFLAMLGLQPGVVLAQSVPSCPPTCPPATPTAEDATYREAYQAMQSGQASNVTNTISQILTTRGQQPENRVALGNTGESGMAASAGGSRWSVWGSAAHSNLAYTFQPLRSSGNNNVALGGVDYTFGNEAVLGMAASVEQSRFKTDFNAGRVRGDGYSFAPYLAIPINNAWMADASIGWGRSDIDSTDNSAATVTGKAKDDRQFGALSLSYASEIGKWQIQGKGSYLLAQDRMSQTVLSSGGRNPSVDSKVTQIRVGGQAGYDLGSFIPFVAVYHVADVGTSKQAPVAGQNAANDRDAWQLQVGVNLYSKGSVSGGVSYATETGRSQIRNDQFVGNISYRF